MPKLAFKRYRHKTDVIRQAVWLYFRFSLSFRDVEEILAEGAVSLTLTCLHLKQSKPLMGMEIREADIVQAPPVSGGRYPPRGLAVLPFQPEFPGRRGVAGPARDRGQL